MRYGVPDHDEGDEDVESAGQEQQPGEDFIRWVIGDDDTGQLINRAVPSHADLPERRWSLATQEWWRRTPEEQALIDQAMSWVRLVESTKATVAQRLQLSRRNVQKTARSAVNIRLWNLDIYDNDTSQLVSTVKEHVSGIENLERIYASTACEGSFVLRAIRYELRDAKKELRQLQEEASKIRSNLYDLKRRSPGRKAVKRHTMAEFKKAERQAYEQMRRMSGPVLRHPRTAIHPAVVQWHRAILDNTGAQNEGTDICLGVAWDGTIVDRRVRKSVQHEGEDYGSAHKWWHFKNGDMYPLEYVTHVMVSQSADARFALQTTAEPQFEASRQMFHLYTEFAACNGLDKVVDAHIELRRPIPEAFIMLVFQSLIENAMIMKKDSTNIKAQTPGDWLEVVHRDLKPANVFLSLPDENHFPCFPKPKVADYGLAVLTHKDDPLNPAFYNSVGTSGYDAPEQSSMHDPVTGKAVDDFPILSPCNVWAIGAIIYTLMTLVDFSMHNVDALPYCVDPKRVKAKGDEFERNLDQDLKRRWGHLKTYNAALRYSVQKCMSFLPEARPGVEELKEWVDAEMRDNEAFRKARQGWAFEGGLYFQEEKEEWKLGMCWPPKAARAGRSRS